MQQQTHKAYDQLLNDFTSYRQSSLAEKEQMRRQIEKCKQQLEKFNSKLDKRVDARLKEQRMVTNHRVEELQQQHQQELAKINSLLAQKDKMIDEFRHHLRTSQAQKRELIHNNTKILVQLSQDLEDRPQGQSQALDSSYKQLLKMYQFLMQENNQLKKDIYNLKRSQLTNPNSSSFLHIQERSLNSSEYKPKSITDSSKAEVFTTNKSLIKDKPKEKPKKPPLQKNSRK